MKNTLNVIVMFTNRNPKSQQWLTKNCSQPPPPHHFAFFQHWPQQQQRPIPLPVLPLGPPVDQLAFRRPYIRPRYNFTTTHFNVCEIANINIRSNTNNTTIFQRKKRISNNKRVFNQYKSLKKRKKTFSDSDLNPSDPLNLQDLMKESERRRIEGLSPVRGDSRLNTPAGSFGCADSPRLPLESPQAQFSPNRIVKKHKKRINNRFNALNSNRYRQQLAITGNYQNYYSRRDPKERLKFFMPEWFNGKEVADYGCHNGTMVFSILEKFPEIKHVDAIDCDSELIANARCMQREKIRLKSQTDSVDYGKIFFQVANWSDPCPIPEEPKYDTILAFSVTKWIHLNGGDAGLMRFFRKAFNLLKPGGHLILEPQPKSSYLRTRYTQEQKDNYRNLLINPSNFESILLDLGFSYFEKIKIPQNNEPFKRFIMLCSKSYGATPASIRNDCRDEAKNCPSWLSPRILSTECREPPPVDYSPQTPNYVLSPNSPCLLLNPPVTASIVPMTSTVTVTNSEPISSFPVQTTNSMENADPTGISNLDQIPEISSTDNQISVDVSCRELFG